MTVRSSLADFDVVAGPAPSRPRPPVAAPRGAESPNSDGSATVQTDPREPGRKRSQ